MLEESCFKARAKNARAFLFPISLNEMRSIAYIKQQASGQCSVASWCVSGGLLTRQHPTWFLRFWKNRGEVSQETKPKLISALRFMENKVDSNLKKEHENIPLVMGDRRGRELHSPNSLIVHWKLCTFHSSRNSTSHLGADEAISHRFSMLFYR